MATQPKASKYDEQQQAQIDALSDQVDELTEQNASLIWLVGELNWKMEQSAKFQAANRKMIKGLYAQRSNGTTAPAQQPQQQQQTPAPQEPTAQVDHTGTDISKKSGRFRCGAGDVRHYHDTSEEVAAHYRALASTPSNT